MLGSESQSQSRIVGRRMEMLLRKLGVIMEGRVLMLVVGYLVGSDVVG
jgi:hypothetical protein